jgi:hypothetical protein
MVHRPWRVSIFFTEKAGLHKRQGQLSIFSHSPVKIVLTMKCRTALKEHIRLEKEHNHPTYLYWHFFCYQNLPDNNEAPRRLFSLRGGASGHHR